MRKEDLYTQFDSIFFEKIRLSIITILYKQETCSFNRLKEILEIGDGAIYTHLKKLKEGGYIKGEKKIIKNKANTIYSLTPAGVSIFKQYLKFLENMVKR